MEGKELAEIAQRAKRRLREIEQKHPKLKAELVFSSHQGQAGIESEPVGILREFPAMIEDGICKEKALKLLGQLPEGEKDKHESGQTGKARKAELDNLLIKLRFREDTNIEVRFKHLSYDVVWALQTDDLQ